MSADKRKKWGRAMRFLRAKGRAYNYGRGNQFLLPIRRGEEKAVRECVQLGVVRIVRIRFWNGVRRNTYLEF